MIVLNQIESWKSVDVVLGSDKEFVITKVQIDSPGHGTGYHCSEPSVIPLSYPGMYPGFYMLNIYFRLAG